MRHSAACATAAAPCCRVASWSQLSASMNWAQRRYRFLQVVLARLGLRQIGDDPRQPQPFPLVILDLGADPLDVVVRITPRDGSTARFGGVVPILGITSCSVMPPGPDAGNLVVTEKILDLFRSPRSLPDKNASLLDMRGPFGCHTKSARGWPETPCMEVNWGISSPVSVTNLKLCFLPPPLTFFTTVTEVLLGTTLLFREPGRYSIPVLPALETRSWRPCPCGRLTQICLCALFPVQGSRGAL